MAARMPGSPASSSELQPTTRIVEVCETLFGSGRSVPAMQVNGHKTDSLDEFVAVLKKVQNDPNLRIKNIDLKVKGLGRATIDIMTALLRIDLG